MEKIDLSMLPTGAVPSIVHCSQGDVNRKFQLALKDETGAAYILDGTETLQITGFKPDGNFFIYDLPSQTGSVIEISTQEQMTARHGDVVCEVRIKKGTTNLGTCNFVLQVEVGPTESGTLSTSAIELVYSIIRRAEEAESTATEAATTATQAATQAVNASSEALGYKDDALAAKNDAVNAKDAAEQAYNGARTQATKAENARIAAEVAERNAANSKTLANTARQEAEGFATSASTSASAAQTAATNAQASADAASASMDDAAEAAETAIAQVALATAQAELASQSASSALASKNSAASSASAANSASATAQTAATNSQNSASAAHTSENNAETYSQNASTFADAAEEALEGLENMSVVATTLPTGADATVTKGTDAEGNVQLTFGLPRGEKGSGPGTEVIPNPEGEPTADLTKISIDGDIFKLAGGGASGNPFTKKRFYPMVYTMLPNGDFIQEPNFRSVRLELGLNELAVDTSTGRLAVIRNLYYSRTFSADDIMQDPNPIVMFDSNNTNTMIALRFARFTFRLDQMSVFDMVRSYNEQWELIYSDPVINSNIEEIVLRRGAANGYDGMSNFLNESGLVPYVQDVDFTSVYTQDIIDFDNNLVGYELHVDINGYGALQNNHIEANFRCFNELINVYTTPRS